MNATRATLLALALAVQALPAAPARAESPAAPAKATAENKTEKKKKVRPVFDLTCEGYLALPEASRPVLVGWVAGQGQRKGSFAPWVVDAASQQKLVADTTAACREAPAASLWVKVQHLVRDYK